MKKLILTILFTIGLYTQSNAIVLETNTRVKKVVMNSPIDDIHYVLIVMFVAIVIAFIDIHSKRASQRY